MLPVLPWVDHGHRGICPTDRYVRAGRVRGNASSWANSLCGFDELALKFAGEGNKVHGLLFQALSIRREVCRTYLIGAADSLFERNPVNARAKGLKPNERYQARAWRDRRVFWS